MTSTICFEPLAAEHARAVMDIFNYYVENSFAAFAEERLPDSFFEKMQEKTKGFPAYVMKDDQAVIGFCYLSAYHPFPTFRETVKISYFIAAEHMGQGIGKMALDRLETDARALGIRTILAEITSENEASLRFHRKNGFGVCGVLERVGYKQGKYFDVVIMQKRL